MKSVTFWKVETPYRIAHFESKAEAMNLYNAAERATITYFVRRNPEKIKAMRERIKEERAEEDYYKQI